MLDCCRKSVDKIQFQWSVRPRWKPAKDLWERFSFANRGAAASFFFIFLPGKGTWGQRRGRHLLRKKSDLRG